MTSGGTFVYKACEYKTTICSNTASVTFDRPRSLPLGRGFADLAGAVGEWTRRVVRNEGVREADARARDPERTIHVAQLLLVRHDIGRTFECRRERETG